MARVLTNVVAFLTMVCVGIAAGCVLEAEDAFERVGKRDANTGRIQSPAEACQMVRLKPDATWSG